MGNYERSHRSLKIKKRKSIPTSIRCGLIIRGSLGAVRGFRCLPVSSPGGRDNNESRIETAFIWQRPLQDPGPRDWDAFFICIFIPF